MPAPPFARILRLLVPVVVLGLCAARNLPWRLSDYDQAKQAFVSLEMTGGGSPWFQHIPGRGRLATKPPLVGWLSAGFHALPGLGGNWEVAWRLPSGLATAALAVLLWRAGRTLWPGAGGAGGWLAVGAFGLNVLTPRLATLVRTDMPLTLWTTAAGLLVWRWRRAGGGGAWTPGERWALFAVVTAAMLTKGPVVYAFLLPGLAGLAIWERRHHRRDDLRVVPSSLWSDECRGGIRDNAGVIPPMVALWPWLLPLGVFALWVAAGCWSVPGFSEQVVGREFLGRFDYSGRAVHVRQPPWFYVAGLLARWAPWSLLLVGTAFVARPAWRAVAREPAGRWLIAWTAGGLLLMSLVPSKRVDRIFPVVPPLCLLLTAVVGRVRETTANHAEPRPLATLAVWTTTAAALAVSLAATGYEVRKGFLRHEDALDQFGRDVRRLVAARGGRPPELAVGARVDESDDTLLVCLRQTRWLENAAARDAWRTGRVDALVLQTTTLDELRPALGAEGADYAVAARMIVTRPRDDLPYVLVVRAPGASP